MEIPIAHRRRAAARGRNENLISAPVASRRYIRAADKMPEEGYGFKPTPEVRSFAQLIGHIADDLYAYSPAVKGEKNPRT